MWAQQFKGEAVNFFSLAVLVWNKGVKNYSSTGS
jgi:ABC-type uncharacterized transport system permease subunit